jgi:hypothetical protein
MMASGRVAADVAPVVSIARDAWIQRPEKDNNPGLID